MDSGAVREALAAIDVGLDALAANVSGQVSDRIALLTRLEGVLRRATVISCELTAGLFGRIAASWAAQHIR